MSERDDKVGVESADLRPPSPCDVDLLRIQLEAEVIRKVWRERDDETAEGGE